MNLRKTSLPILSMILLLNACKKVDDATVAPVQLSPAKGLYILNEGTGTNDSKLSLYDITTGTTTGNFFQQQNPTELIGKYANDAIVYGSNLFILVNGSGNVIIADAKSAILKKRIAFVTPATPAKNPRYAVAFKKYVYISASDNTVTIIDTASLSVAGSITVGANPEGMAIVGNSLYVANSGGYNNTPDSTVSVVDLNTNTEIKKIKVGTKNPQKIEANSMGDLYITGYGNFTNIPPSVSVISSATNTLKMELGASYPYAFLRIFNDVAYFYNNYGGGGTAKVYNTITNSVVRNDFVTDGTLVTTPYGLNIDEQNGDVYITDAINYTTAGKVTCFSSLGVKKFSLSVSPGVNPNKIIFLR